MNQHKPFFKEIPLAKIVTGPNQPRNSFEASSDDFYLLTSIKRYGIEEPIKVSQMEQGRFAIIDGHRRYLCAKKLQLATVPCRVYPKMDQGEFEARRYEMQNNRLAWRPPERTAFFNRIKKLTGFKNSRELATLIHISETSVDHSPRHRNRRFVYSDLMRRYDISDSYRLELMRLIPRLRRISKLEPQDITKVLIEKIKHKVIKNAKELRVLSRMFLRATANEAELCRFLTDPDTTIGELEQHTLRSGFALKVEQLIQDILVKKQTGVDCGAREKDLLNQLNRMIKGVL